MKGLSDTDPSSLLMLFEMVPLLVIYVYIFWTGNWYHVSWLITSIYLFIHPSSICLPIYCVSICLPARPSIHPSINPFLKILVRQERNMFLFLMKFILTIIHFCCDIDTFYNIISLPLQVSFHPPS